MAKEQKFHVMCGREGIFAGVLIEDNCWAWQERSEVTLEALCAVRDHMLSIIPEGDKSVSFHWLDDERDKALTLTLAVDSDAGSKLTVGTPVNELGLSARVVTCLHRLGCKVAQDIQSLSIRDLLFARNLGVKGYQEIINRFDELGLYCEHLRMSETELKNSLRSRRVKRNGSVGWYTATDGLAHCGRCDKPINPHTYLCCPYCGTMIDKEKREDRD